MYKQISLRMFRDQIEALDFIRHKKYRSRCGRAYMIREEVDSFIEREGAQEALGRV